ncbi:MAG: hypothetical protein DHS20C13_18870 [Thermodesulfobacteriota bacterium]|nr:MAG: hypothetical protein DHS20C13_18870 [Thermodesulfobacteriota bacterium]
MKRVKKVSIWLSVTVLIIVILIGTAFYIASHLIQKDSIQQKIDTIISKKIGGDVHYESMNLYFFHWPHIVIRKGEFNVPEKVKGSFESLMVFPKILPLLYGDVEISTLRFYSPDITVYLSDMTEETESEDKESFSFDEIKQKVVQALDHLNSHEKGLDARAYRAKLQIMNEDGEFLNFNNLNAVISFPDNVLSYQINANSNISRIISLKGSINTKSYDADGVISFTGFKPHMLEKYVLPKNDLELESKLDLNLNYSSQQLEIFKGNLVVANSEITLSKGDEKFKISGKKIDTDLYLDENKSVFTINSAEFIHPDVKASGEHHIDRSSNRVNLNLIGTDVNVESSRDAVLFIAGGDRIVDLIFDIVRGGTVPEVTLQASGENFKDLWKRDNFEIKANMVNGNIFVPIGNFDLTDVSGDAVIGNGKLEGTNLKAKSGNSTGYDGTFIIGIEGPIGPLHLDIDVDADAAEIPGIIKKFIDDKGFLYELSLIENLQGTASGKLKIGDTKKSPDTIVDVTSLDITGDYKRVPEPVNIKGNKFTFTKIDKSIDFEGLNVAIGNFVAPQTTGYYHWKDDKFIKIGTKQANIDLSIMFPWLNSFEIIRPHLRHIDSMAGSAFFSTVDFTGPVSQSDQWEINAQGNVDKIDVNLDGFGSVMTVTKAEIESSSQNMTLSNASVQIKDSLMSVGAVLKDYFRDNLKLTMDFYGDMLADEAKLFSDYFSVPEQLDILSPVSISDSSLVVQKIPSSNSSTPNDTSNSKTGNVSKEIDLNMNIVAESLEWKVLEVDTRLETGGESELPETDDSTKARTSLNGKVAVKSDNFTYKGFDWDTVDAEVSLLGNKIDVNVNEANLCGIKTPGLLEITSPTLKLEFEPFSEEESLANAIQCLFDKAGIITGDFNLGGTVNSDGEIVDVMKSLEGELELTSNGGRVSKYGGLARFFSALNFGEIFRGNSIDYEDEGFPYDYIMANADINEGQLIIKEAAMDGPSLKVVCEGSIDLVNDQLDLKVMVIPVMAVDSVIEKIPLISAVLGKDVVSIPIKVTGDISDPKISELSPHTIGAGLLGIIKQTLNIPVTLVKPLNSGKKKEKVQEPESASSIEASDETKAPDKVEASDAATEE